MRVFRSLCWRKHQPPAAPRGGCAGNRRGRDKAEFHIHAARSGPASAPQASIGLLCGVMPIQHRALARQHMAATVATLPGSAGSIRVPIRPPSSAEKPGGEPWGEPTGRTASSVNSGHLSWAAVTR